MRILSIAASLFVAAPAMAGQTQVQQDRLDRVAQFLVTAPMCEKLGMTVDDALPDKMQHDFDTETSSWGIGQDALTKLKIESLQRQSTMLKVDLATASKAKTDTQLRKTREVLLRYGRTCVAATSDPIFSRLIKMPSGYNLDAAATAASDEMLEGGGLASWQTPAIQARGDLMMLAGTCRARIGSARSDALRTEYGRSDDPRVRNYYAKSFDAGLEDPSIIATLAGCNRAIMKSRQKAAVTPSG